MFNLDQVLVQQGHEVPQIAGQHLFKMFAHGATGFDEWLAFVKGNFKLVLGRDFFAIPPLEQKKRKASGIKRYLNQHDSSDGISGQSSFGFSFFAARVIAQMADNAHSDEFILALDDYELQVKRMNQVQRLVKTRSVDGFSRPVDAVVIDAPEVLSDADEQAFRDLLRIAATSEGVWSATEVDLESMILPYVLAQAFHDAGASSLLGKSDTMRYGNLFSMAKKIARPTLSPSDVAFRIKNGKVSPELVKKIQPVLDAMFMGVRLSHLEQRNSDRFAQSGFIPPK